MSYQERLPFMYTSMATTTLPIMISFLLYATAAQNDVVVSEVKAPEAVKRKVSHLRVYWHDIVSGQHPTSIPVVKSPTPATGFGQVSIIDNPLTLGPNISSEVVGRAQGFYALASQEDLALLMTMNFAFTTGKYNGSAITILGRNHVMSHVREMPVVGGSGLFRFATGYAEARTHWVNFKTRDATVEYNVYVLHY